MPQLRVSTKHEIATLHCVPLAMTLGFSVIATTALAGPGIERAIDGKNARLSERRGNLKKVTFLQSESCGACRSFAVSPGHIYLPVII